MTAAVGDGDVSIPFGAAGVDDFTGASSGNVYGANAAALNAGDLADFNAAVVDIKRRAEAAKSVRATANWTEVACNNAAAGAQGALRADKGCTVILSGVTPGTGTVLSAPTGGKTGQALPETPTKPISLPEQGVKNQVLLDDDAYVASGFHAVGEGDGLLVVPGRGVYGAKALLAAAKRDKKETAHLLALPPLPLLDLDENPAIPVNAEGAGTCKTFGATPQVLVQPPARFHVSVAAAVKTVVVAISLTVEITPVRASFGRTGTCWQGICSREEITGLVFSTVRVHFTLRATGAIKIGRWTIGGGNIVFTTDISVPSQTNYTLTTG